MSTAMEPDVNSKPKKDSAAGIIGRVVISAGTVWAYELGNQFLIKQAGLTSAELAVTQVQDVDQPGTQALSRELSGAHVPGIILLFALAATWAGPVKRAVTKLKASNILSAVAVATALTAPVHRADAYYMTRDNEENVDISANETAFLVPVSGANEKSQAQFGSEQYFADNKVPAKRIKIPHVVIRNSWVSSDYYVPSMKVWVVNRAPYAREWVDDSDRGTSSKKEGFSMETNESINVKFGVIVAASIKEEDAARYLYYFGARTDPRLSNLDQRSDEYMQGLYSSRVDARSLENVMDTVVRAEAQTAFFKEFANRDLETAIKQKSAINEAVQADVKAFAKQRGITIEALSIATPLDFDPKIQNAIDSVFINDRLAVAASKISGAGILQTLQQQAEIEVVKGLADAIKDGKLPQLPSLIILPDSLAKAVSGFIGSPQVPSMSGQQSSLPQPRP